MLKNENTGEFYASRISGAQRLKNGNTLVCEGTEGRLLNIIRAMRLHGNTTMAPKYSEPRVMKAIIPV